MAAGPSARDGAAQGILPLFYLLEMNSFLNIRGLDSSCFLIHIPRVALFLSSGL